MENSSLWFRPDAKDEKEAPKTRQNVSFKFSKLTPKALSGNKLSGKNLDRETVLSVENKEIKSSVPKEEKKKLVILPIQKNVWRSVGSISQDSEPNKDAEKSINDLAVEELLKESAVKNAKWESREPPSITIKIPVVIQNKLPEGFETDEKLDVSLRAEDSTLEDYENIPVNDFGTAVLRGLGCNPGDPIGNKNPKFVEPIQAVQRSKGLGLGANKKMQKDSKPDEELKLVAGAYVRVGQGVHRGSYGVVEGLDESRVIIKLSELEKSVSLPSPYVDVVSKKEFHKESKVINKDSYDTYQDEYMLNNVKNATDEEVHSPQDKESSKLKRKHSKHRELPSKKHNTHETEKPSSDSWVRPLLKVRFIDEKYKKGKYYNEKMIIEDVMSIESCVCKTENGKYLDDIRPSMLETVIPRSDPSHVMIVKGKHQSQLGAILSRDKRECTATVQLLSDRSKVIVSHYDSICEYVGDISLFD